MQSYCFYFLQELMKQWILLRFLARYPDFFLLYCLVSVVECQFGSHNTASLSLISLFLVTFATKSWIVMGESESFGQLRDSLCNSKYRSQLSDRTIEVLCRLAAIDSPVLKPDVVNAIGRVQVNTTLNRSLTTTGYVFVSDFVRGGLTKEPLVLFNF